jgi:tetratricopeptide (TPR) repeat protein
MKAARRLSPAVLIGSAMLGALAILAQQTGARQEKGPGEPEAVSLLGRPLYRTPATGEALAKLEGDLRAAALKLEGDPESPETIILYGRALASLWRYREAVDVYSRGIAAHPDHAMLHRHRGHRYITLRALDRAVSDLARAAELDGQDFDIWYHLGLAHFLCGEFALAEPAYRRCRAVCKDDGSVIAVSNWLYLTLRRMGRTAEAAQVLEGVQEGMEPGENGAYHNLLLFYKGKKSEAELEAAASKSDLDLATTGYGLACWHLANGDKDKASAYLERILAVPYWPAFGFIAAEAERARADRRSGR